MEPICQLDDNNADILCHGHKHLADTLGLGAAIGDIFFCTAFRDEVYACQFGDAVHQSRNLGAESLLQLLLGKVTVFNDIVEKGGGKRSGILFEIGKVEGCAEGVLNVGLTGHANLTIVLGGGKLIRLLHQLKAVF